MIVGANFKQPDTAKCCAEVDVLLQVEELEVPRVLGIIVVGSTDVEEIKDVTGIESKTLPPCEDCVSAIRASHYISDHSPIISAGLDEDVYQVRTARGLERMYESGVDCTDVLHEIDSRELSTKAQMFSNRTQNYRQNTPSSSKVKRPSIAAIASVTFNEQIRKA